MPKQPGSAHRKTSPRPAQRGVPSRSGVRESDDQPGWSYRPDRAERRRRERARKKSDDGVSVPRWVWWSVGGSLPLAVIVLLLVLLLTRSTPPNRASDPPTGVQTFDEPNRNHVKEAVTYDRTPPAGGNHNPVWLNCGIYDQPVQNENAVHSLEHGAVWITYQPSLPSAEVQSLRTLVPSEYDGVQRYVILSPYPGLPTPVVATAWGHQLSVGSAGDARIAQFIEYYREGPQDLEPGAACSGGTGTPIG